jgi:hypothetical protein
MMTEVLGYNIVGGASVVLVYISKRQVVYIVYTGKSGGSQGRTGSIVSASMECVWVRVCESVYARSLNTKV